MRGGRIFHRNTFRSDRRNGERKQGGSVGNGENKRRTKEEGRERKMRRKKKENRLK